MLISGIRAQGIKQHSNSRFNHQSRKPAMDEKRQRKEDQKERKRKKQRLLFLVVAQEHRTWLAFSTRYEKKIKFVEQPIGPIPDLETAYPDTIDQYYEIVNFEQEVACLILSSMSPDLQRTLEKYKAYDMIQELKTIFEEQAKHELFETVKAFHACK
ncbi:hypothetical protein Tco_0413760 [Tanacetum coccineum]